MHLLVLMELVNPYLKAMINYVGLISCVVHLFTHFSGTRTLWGKE